MIDSDVALLSTLDTSGFPENALEVLGDVDEVVVFALPMNVRFRGITRREGLLLRGANGWGECSPFWDYDPKESARWLQSALVCATEGLSPTPAGWFRSEVAVNLTVPVVSVEEARRRVLAQRGCRTAKVKVADDRRLTREDGERVEAVAAVLRDLYGDEGRIRIDANTAWSVGEAAQALAVLNEAAAPLGGLEYAEQPTESTGDLAELRGLTDVPVAADESIRRGRNPLDVVALDAADVGVVKVAPLGGPPMVRRVISEVGLPTTVSSALDSSIGLAAGVALSASLEHQPYAAGLNTATMFKSDVIDEPLIAAEGVLDLDQALKASTAELTAKSRAVEADVVARWAARLEAMALALYRAPAVPWWTSEEVPRV